MSNGLPGASAHGYTEGYEAGIARPGSETEAAFAVRMTVFVEEQHVPPEEELDAYDVTAIHFVVRRTGGTEAGPMVVATARLVEKGAGVGKIGRVAVLASHRRTGIGSLLMRAVEADARHRGLTHLVLESQCHAIPFYERLGYTAHGEVFLDAGIEHRLMDRAL